jgi:hypothetical protein
MEERVEMGARSRISMVTRVVAVLMAAFLVVSAIGSLFDADASALVWVAMALVAAAAIVGGLLVGRTRAVAGAVILSVGAVLAGATFFWFPPFWIVALLVVAGALWSLRTPDSEATPIAG